MSGRALNFPLPGAWKLDPQIEQTNPGIFLSTAGQRLHFRKMSPSIKPGRRDDRPLPVIGMFKLDVADDRYVVFETGAVRQAVQQTAPSTPFQPMDARFVGPSPLLIWYFFRH